MQPFVIDGDGASRPLRRIKVGDEIRELQDLVHRNPELLAGDQIRPDDPRRWLLIKREMPVPDPLSGEDRWSLDFLYADQSAIPTLVECKRYRDTRGRREVVGQLLDYAANAHRYWTAAALMDHASASLGQATLASALDALQPDDDLEPEAFFERLVGNLKQGQVRLVFLVEEARPELVAIVEYLNQQMERSDVLLLELRQFVDGALRIVVPVLHGYTEQAREVKRTVVVEPAGPAHRWDEARFFQDAERRLPPDHLKPVRAVYDFLRASPLRLAWGKGASRGSFGPRFTAIQGRTLFTVYSDGQLILNFGWCNGSPEADELCDAWRQAVTRRLNWPLAESGAGAFPTREVAQWGPQVDTLIGILKDMLPVPHSGSGIVPPGAV